MKKMMFNDYYALTKAVIERLKRLTHRLLKNQSGNLVGQIKYTKKGSDLVYVRADFDNGISEDCYYAIGETVAVSQSYGSLVTYNSDRCYPELTEKINDAYNLCCEHIGHLEELAGWTNKMFVKANLMTHQLRILDVRAERLQDITDEDCLKEGITQKEIKIKGTSTIFSEQTYKCKGIKAGVIYSKQSPREAFASLINKISGKGTWDSNPYTWRIEFELIK